MNKVAVFLVGAGLSVAPATGAQGGDDVSALAWLTGHWRGGQDGLEMEEVWTAPAGGMLLGLHRDVKGGRSVSWEFLRIEQTQDGPVYLASPRGRPATPFKLVESGERRAVFANPQHDFPQRILYWIEADGALHARVEGAAGKALEWRWEKAAP
jgi:hypothetical protein